MENAGAGGRIDVRPDLTAPVSLANMARRFANIRAKCVARPPGDQEDEGFPRNA